MSDLKFLSNYINKCEKFQELVSGRIPKQLRVLWSREVVLYVFCLVPKFYVNS